MGDMVYRVAAKDKSINKVPGWMVQGQLQFRLVHILLGYVIVFCRRRLSVIDLASLGIGIKLVR